jgi:hypothetical protein
MSVSGFGRDGGDITVHKCGGNHCRGKPQFTLDITTTSPLQILCFILGPCIIAFQVKSLPRKPQQNLKHNNVGQTNGHSGMCIEV